MAGRGDGVGGPAQPGLQRLGGVAEHLGVEPHAGHDGEAAALDHPDVEPAAAACRGDGDGLGRVRGQLAHVRPQHDSGNRQPSLVDVGHLDKLARRAYPFGGRVAHRAPQLICAWFLDEMIQRVKKPVLHGALVLLAVDAYGERLVAAVDLHAVVAECHEHDVHHGLVPVVRLVCEGEVVGVDVQQRIHE